MRNQQQELQIYDIYDMWYRPFWQRPWFFWLMITIGLILFSGIILWFLIRWWNKKKIISPAQSALEALNVLQKKDLEPHHFYVDLTAIIKRYVSNEYRVQLVGKTDNEVLKLLARKVSLLPTQVIQTITQVFDGVTLVKFAQQSVVQERMASDVDRTRNMIEKAVQKKDK